jgi:hypothetical protein
MINEIDRITDRYGTDIMPGILNCEIESARDIPDCMVTQSRPG